MHIDCSPHYTVQFTSRNPIRLSERWLKYGQQNNILYQLTVTSSDPPCSGTLEQSALSLHSYLSRDYFIPKEEERH